MNRTLLSPHRSSLSLTASVVVLFFFFPGVAHAQPNSNWRIEGNGNIDPAFHFLGTTNFADLFIRTNNQPRIRVLSTGQVEMTSDLTLTLGDLLVEEGNLILANGDATLQAGNLLVDHGHLLIGTPSFTESLSLGPMAVIRVVGDKLTLFNAGFTLTDDDLTLDVGDLMMPLGSWRGFALPGGGDGLGDLTLNIGDIFLTSGNVDLTNGDLIMPQGSWKGTAGQVGEGDLSMTSGDLFVEDGVVGIGLKSGEDPILVDSYDVVLAKNRIRIGDLRDPVFPPANEAVLHIEAVGGYPGIGQEAHHAVFIKSHNIPGDSSVSPDGIAIQLDATFDNNFVNDKNNFVTFYDQGGVPLGAIEANPGGNPPPAGIGFRSGSADFAEYLEKMDPADEFQGGEIVGVFGGKVSRQTQGADHILVITTSPVVLGNAPQPHLEDLYAKVAFLGQVPVRVRGGVNAGDYIVPSGLEDGTGIALSAEDLGLADLSHIIGTAWSESDGFGVDTGFVTVGIGIRSAIDLGGIAPQQQVAIRALKAQLAAREAQLDQTQAQLDALGQRVAQLEAALHELARATSR